MRTASFALCLLLSGAGAAVAQGKVKLATLVPEGSIWDKAVRRMGADWKKSTESRLQLRIYPGGVAGDEPDIVRKMRIGQLHGAMLTSSGLGDLDAAFRVFETPFLFETDEEVLYVLEKLRPELERRVEESGFVLVHFGHAGWLRIFSTEPVRSFDDFKRLKQFVWGAENRLVDWFQEKGLRPVPLAATDVLTGLQTGLIDAVPITPLAALSLQWFRSAPYMLEMRIAPLIGGTVISKRTWNKIREEDREGILRAARETEDFLFAEVPEQEEEALDEMERRGLSVTKTDELTGREAWEDLALHLETRFREETVPREIFDQVSSCLEQVRAGDEEDSD